MCGRLSQCAQAETSKGSAWSQVAAWSRFAPAWLIAAVAGAICVASRALPWHDAVATTKRVGPILLFLVAITVVAELADAAQVFDVAATRAAKLGRGRTWELFALIVVLGSLTTIVLSLDTTAVLLTPVVLTLAAQLRISVIPFAMAAVWLANTASLLLPVSNLTNLLAVNRLHLSAVSFAAKMWLPAIASIIVTAVVIGVAYRRDLRGHYPVPGTFDIADRVSFRISATVCVVDRAVLRHRAAGVVTRERRCRRPARSLSLSAATARPDVTAAVAVGRLGPGTVPCSLRRSAHMVSTDCWATRPGTATARSVSCVPQASVRARATSRTTYRATSRSSGSPTDVNISCSDFFSAPTSARSSCSGDRSPRCSGGKDARRGTSRSAPGSSRAVGLVGVPVLLLASWATLLLTA